MPAKRTETERKRASRQFWARARRRYGTTVVAWVQQFNVSRAEKIRRIHSALSWRC